MPDFPRETVLCRYRYDPLDRLGDCAPCAEVDIQRFYCKSRLATEIQGAVQRSVFQHDDQLLAQLRREDVKVETALLATDQQRSVLNVLDANRVHPLAYSPYGHRPAENGLLSLLGFNGERPDPVTGHYLLGNGYRAFNPVLMQFNSPDSLSPFGEGGLNAYGYCGGDSINRSDPTGHFWGLGTLLRNWKVIPQKNIDIPKTAYKAFQGHPVMYKKNNINPKLNKTQTEPVSLSGLTSKQIAQIAYSVDHFNLELAKPLTKTVPDFGSKIKNINTPNHQIISTTSKRKAITSLKNILEVSNDLHNLPIKRANDTWDNMSLSTSRTGIAVQFNEKVEIQYIAKYIRDLSTN